ncbi:MAG: tyrosine-type recombinase/integrase [Candidatus Gastranaerophilales bacterium]|nr:tyrosine-type recombinase/integrase [Candidatus Gastranaerophilales bacterium]
MELLTTISTDLNIENSIQKLVERFLAAQDVKENSKATYRRALKPFFEWVRINNIESNSRETILAYKSFLINQELSALTISNYLVAVRKFYEWLESMKICPNIAKGIKGAKQSRSFKKDPLTVSQIKELLNGIDRTTLQGKRDFAILNLLIRTGLRTIEVIRANIEDIRQNSGEAVLWIQGKGRDNKDEFVLLTAESLKPINQYLQARGKAEDKEPLFTSLSDRNHNKRLTTRTISRIVKQNLRNIGLNNDRLTAHSLRHTAITLSLLGGASIQEAQALGRHANINTTLVYSHNINRITNAPEYKIDKLLAV